VEKEQQSQGGQAVSEEFIRIIWVDHSRQLERELNAANQRIKRLEEAVETSIRAMEFYGPTSNIADSCKLLKLEMIKAKEAKP
jgi:hypothetical protein